MRLPLLSGIVLLTLLASSGCTRNLGVLQSPGRSVALTSPDVARSLIFLARTDSGVVAVDLGWTGAGGALRRGLRRLGSRPEEVRAVFLTHSHRDHIFGWRAVRSARFHLAEAELPLFRGAEPHRDLPSRAAAAVFRDAYPRRDSLRLHGFASDTAFVLGGDTLRAFSIPGHTAGSAAYLFRGVLFVGDAVYYSWWRGYQTAVPIFTDDRARSRASVSSLWSRVERYPVRSVCTAHAKCVDFQALRAKLDRG